MDWSDMSASSATRNAHRVVVAAALTAALSLHAQDAPRWPDTYVARLEALALMQTLNAEILASRSATATLENWCRTHRLADEPRIVADAVRGVDNPLTADQRERLEITDRDTVRYRRVRLRCGTRVLSEAENWYVPSRLTPEMNRLLDTTDTPFGRVVAVLEPYRRTFAVALLWEPLPDGWARDPRALPPTSGGALTIPDALFEHRAILYTGAHKPFSEVHEVYQRHVLAM
jgi:chorismate-pyruvate lyase